MEFIQAFLVYLSLFIAVFYLIRLWFLPQPVRSGVKSKKKACGEDSCGCS